MIRSWTFTAALEGFEKGAKAKTSPAPAGYSPIPGSRAGGYRKRTAGKWRYWYPLLGHADASEARIFGDETADSTVARLVQDGLRKLSNPDHVAERVWHGIKTTAHEFPEALAGLGKLARGQTPTRHEALAMVSVTAMVGTTALIGAKYGTGAGAMTFGAKFAIHVAMAALHDHANVAYTGHAGHAFAEKVMTYGQHLLHALPGADTDPPDIDEPAARDFISTIVRGMRDELERRSKTKKALPTPSASMTMFSDILEKAAKGSQKAGAKYKSRKPDGKGGWLYDYGTGYTPDKPSADAPLGEVTAEMEEAYDEGELDAATMARVEQASLASNPDGGQLGVEISTSIGLALESQGLIEILDEEFGDSQPPFVLTDKGKTAALGGGTSSPRRGGGGKQKSRAELLQDYKTAIERSDMSPAEKRQALKRSLRAVRLYGRGRGRGDRQGDAFLVH
jgi:hypothetical protein